jgi:hypothetical protein
VTARRAHDGNWGRVLSAPTFKRDNGESASHKNRVRFTPSDMRAISFAKILIPILLASVGVPEGFPADPAPSAGQNLAPVAAPPGVAIDFYPVTSTKPKGGRYINTRLLPRLGYVAAAPALNVERLRAVKKTEAKVKKSVESADGKVRTVTEKVPAIEMTLQNADATAFTNLMKQSIGQRIYIEAERSGIYAPLVRNARRTTTLTFSLGDEAQREEVYRKLVRFVKD